MGEAVVDVAEVKAYEMKSGNVRYVRRDGDGNLPGDAVEREVSADGLFGRLQPFKELVADDIDRDEE